jgi:GAF domain-containing protein
MKWKDLLPSRLKWLTYIPLIMIDKVLNYVKHEKRKWVLILLFILGLTYSLKDAITAQLTVDPIPTQVQKSTIVNTKLNDLIESSGASRAYIFQFHNGITFYTGQHAQRFSCTYETVREGVSREASNLQNLQVSIFSWWTHEVLSGRMTYYNVENIEDYTTRISLQQQGIKSIICRPLVYNNRVVGIVGLDYVRNRNPIVNDSSFMRSFERESVHIARLVSE